MTSTAAQTSAHPQPTTTRPTLSAFALLRRIRASKLPKSGKLVLEAIADICRCGQNPHGCTAYLGTLAKACRISPRQVGRMLVILEAAGWIVIERFGKSKFAHGAIHLGPTCWVLSTDDAPRQAEKVHLDSQGSAPSQPGSVERTMGSKEPLEYEETTTDGPIGSLSSLGGSNGEPRQPAAKALDLAVVQMLVTRLVALQLRRSQSEPTEIDAPLAERLITGAARWCQGGLRWIAWAIHLAEHRPAPAAGKGPVRFWSWFVQTLRNWQDHEGESPDGWPPEPRAAAAVAPSSARQPAADPPEPPTPREELLATIAALEAKKSELAAKKRTLPSWEETELRMTRDALAALDASTDPGGPNP